MPSLAATVTGRRNPLYEQIAGLDVGERIVLVHGSDFTGDIESQRSNIYAAMRLRGVECRTTRHYKQLTVTIIRKGAADAAG